MQIIWRFRRVIIGVLVLLLEYIDARRDRYITDEEWKELTDRLRRIIDMKNI